METTGSLPLFQGNAYNREEMTMNHLRTRIWSALLSTALLLSLLPMGASAAGSVLDQYNDLSPDAWYAQAVEYVLENGIMSGTSQHTFSPNATVTRGMAVQMIYAMAGKPNIGSHTYEDVRHGDWYYDAVAWATNKQIMYGYQEGRFVPGDPITREQLALVLYNYALSFRYDIRPQADLSTFADGNSVSSWAEEAMIWSVGSGLLSGREGNRLNPGSSATRAEVAQIMMKFIQNVVD